MRWFSGRVNVPSARESLHGAALQVDPSQSYPDYLDLRDRNRTFESLAALKSLARSAWIPAGIPPPRGPISPAATTLMHLAFSLIWGAFFTRPMSKGNDSAPYIVLSYAYWHSHFDEDRGVIGRAVDINKHPFTIIGVAPPEFRGTELFFAPGVLCPTRRIPTIQGADNLQYRSNHSHWVIGRLKPGVTPEAATADLNALVRGLRKLILPTMTGSDSAWRVPALLATCWAAPRANLWLD